MAIVVLFCGIGCGLVAVIISAAAGNHLVQIAAHYTMFGLIGALSLVAMTLSSHIGRGTDLKSM